MYLRERDLVAAVLFTHKQDKCLADRQRDIANMAVWVNSGHPDD
jgi:hypothetical protein